MVKEITSKGEFDELLSSNKGKLVVVDFTATWCGPCRSIGPKFEALSKKEGNANVVFVKVDVDKVPELTDKYKVTAMPTFMFFKDGKIETIVGANEGKLEAKINELRT
ncbi:thioredoxin-like [Takifugu flavidus]|uniref:thioredoxin-like n=1 Tax=Takifugu flavidus TaxID=433684 RepID=UPI00254459E4|nr:thioredoxin-like [Takifugu flavidus]